MLPLHSAAIGFAILSTNGMIWWTAPVAAAETGMLVAAGATAGMVWFKIMRGCAVRFGWKS